jgi:hypothetical protein
VSVIDYKGDNELEYLHELIVCMAEESFNSRQYIVGNSQINCYKLAVIPHDKQSHILHQPCRPLENISRLSSMP